MTAALSLETRTGTRARRKALALATIDIAIASMRPHIDVRSADECWVWLGTVNDSGYGRHSHRSHDFRAHRLAWQAANGPVPDGLFVCHRCDNPPCCNPAHLFLGTNSDNIADKVAKGRGRNVVAETNAQKTECVRGHALAGPNLYVHQGKRYCRTCRADYRRTEAFREGRRKMRARKACETAREVAEYVRRELGET